MDTAETIKPALTPDEWATMPLSTFHASDHCIATFPERRHAIAACALYGQPFGFTRQDVERLRALASYIREHDPSWLLSGADPEARNWADALANRIAALLPPE